MNQLLQQKTDRIQQQEIMKKFYEEEEKKRQEKERKERLVSSPWKLEWSHMKEQHKKMMQAFAPKNAGWDW